MLLLLAAATLASCSSGGFGSFGETSQPAPAPAEQTLPPAQGQSLGRGSVRVALLLPLSGDPALAAVGTSMANGASLAIEFIEQSAALGENITIVLKDTGTSPAGAAQMAAQAIAEGASLILGPLRADQVAAVASVARPAGIPVIGFSNTSAVAGPGVFLLNVLPEVEVRRSLGYAQAQGRRAFAAIVPATEYGRAQEAAYRRAVAELGLSSVAVYSFASESEARSAVEQLAPLVLAGQLDALFLPDRATAPSFGVLLEAAGIGNGRIQLIGSADWNGDTIILNAPNLAGAVFPALDDAGYQALSAEYRTRFGMAPHRMATMAYTAAILANSAALALGTPRYDRTQLTLPAGYNGRDGVFRFLADGRSEIALVVKQVAAGGATVVDLARL